MHKDLIERQIRKLIICPITKTIMNDPVLCEGEIFSFDRSSVEGSDTVKILATHYALLDVIKAFQRQDINYRITCPISQSEIKSALVLGDGHTFDEKSLYTWLNSKKEQNKKLAKEAEEKALKAKEKADIEKTTEAKIEAEKTAKKAEELTLASLIDINPITSFKIIELPTITGVYLNKHFNEIIELYQQPSCTFDEFFDALSKGDKKFLTTRLFYASDYFYRTKDNLDLFVWALEKQNKLMLTTILELCPESCESHIKKILFDFPDIAKTAMSKCIPNDGNPDSWLEGLAFDSSKLDPSMLETFLITAHKIYQEEVINAATHKDLLENKVRKIITCPYTNKTMTNPVICKAPYDHEIIINIDKNTAVEMGAEIFAPNIALKQFTNAFEKKDSTYDSKCAITQTTMISPIIVQPEGLCFEEDALVEWVSFEVERLLDNSTAKIAEEGAEIAKGEAKITADDAEIAKEKAETAEKEARKEGATEETKAAAVTAATAATMAITAATTAATVAAMTMATAATTVIEAKKKVSNAGWDNLTIEKIGMTSHFFENPITHGKMTKYIYDTHLLNILKIYKPPCSFDDFFKALSTGNKKFFITTFFYASDYFYKTKDGLSLLDWAVKDDNPRMIKIILAFCPDAYNPYRERSFYDREELWSVLSLNDPTRDFDAFFKILQTGNQKLLISQHFHFSNYFYFSNYSELSNTFGMCKYFPERKNRQDLFTLALEKQNKPMLEAILTICPESCEKHISKEIRGFPPKDLAQTLMRSHIANQKVVREQTPVLETPPENSLQVDSYPFVASLLNNTEYKKRTRDGKKENQNSLNTSGQDNKKVKSSNSVHGGSCSTTSTISTTCPSTPPPTKRTAMKVCTPVKLEYMKALRFC